MTRKDAPVRANRDGRRSWVHVLIAGGLAFAVVAAALVAPAFAQSVGELPEVRGAGSTWSENAVQQWRADVARFGLKVNYQGVGSSAGRQFFIGSQVDWAISEIPFQQGENASNFSYLPIIAGGTSLMYNLTQGGAKVTNLRLDAPTIAGIFTCRIKRWDDPAIKSQNEGLDVDNKDIVPVSRSDGSGTSYQFTAYLRAMGVWPKEPFSQFDIQQEFGCGSSAALSDGVANYVHDDNRGKGAITYVETSYAIERGRPVVAEKNASGNYVLPTSANVTAALTAATLNPDRTQNLTGVYANPDPNSYPNSSYSYMIVRTDSPPAKSQTTGRFIVYSVCDGQAKAEPLGYAPMPPNLRQAAFDGMAAMPGAPAPPSMEDCLRGGVGESFVQSGAASGSGGGGSGSGGGSGQAAGATDANADAAAAGDANAAGAAAGTLDAGNAADVAKALNLKGVGGTNRTLFVAGLAFLAVMLAPPLLAGFFARRG
jgi:phosphate transport system substrate-binding protein